jgi:hypothetical protein
MKLLLCAVALSLSLPLAAEASCRISNQTKHSFKVKSGNTSNQRVGANTTTSIAPGTIIGTSDDGKSVSGSCKSGDQLKIVSERGVPVIVPK